RRFGGRAHRRRARTEADLQARADDQLRGAASRAPRGRTLDDMEGKPVGRRVFLGMLGVGAGGILFGSKVQDLMERTLAPVTARDGTGLSSLLPTGRFRIYSVTGDLPSQAADQYRLRVGGAVR